MLIQHLRTEIFHSDSPFKLPGRSRLLERKVVAFSDIHGHYGRRPVRVDDALLVEKLADDFRVRDDNDVGVEYLERIDRSIFPGPFLESVWAAVSRMLSTLAKSKSRK